MGQRRHAGKTSTPDEATPPTSRECHCAGECGGHHTCLPGTYGPDDPGGGPYDPTTGVRDWYLTGPDSADGITWAALIGDHWPRIELDLADRGVDIESGVLDTRTWSWLKLRIADLAGQPDSRLHHALTKGR